MDRIARLITAGIILGFGAVTAAEAGPANRDDYVAAARRIIPLAQRGDAHAQAMLGFMYANGRGVPQSYEVAVDWYLQAAEGGDPTGQHLLGLMYDKGFGVTQNVIMAYKWLNLAAAHASPQNRENFLRMRDAVASKMTRAQIDVGQQLALEFVPRAR
jgi:TPR repeat protein